MMNMPILQTAVTKEDENYPKTLYVGNLDPQVSESLIMELFSVIGPVKSCKMIPDPHGLDPYCFVEFFSHAHAMTAHGAMNQRKILGKEIKVNWATRPAGKRDTSNHHHIFVGDLAPETTSDDLKTYFMKAGEVSDARVMRDLQNNKSKGYGFVSFVNYQDAQDIVEKKTVIAEALHGRQVRCNWAARKGGQTGTVQRLDYNVIVNQSSQTNCTVYLGGCMSGLNEQLMRDTFAGYGSILETRCFPDKGYAFIRLNNHEDAARAIVAKHGSQLEGYTVKCSWGKEGATLGGSSGMSASSAATAAYTNGQYGAQMGQGTMDATAMQQMSQWSQSGAADMWGMNSQQQQQYNQWTAWSRNPAQQQQQAGAAGQQTNWNTWAPNPMSTGTGNTWSASSLNQSGASAWGGQQQMTNNTWGPMTGSNNTWATANTQQQQQPNSWGWPNAAGMGQQAGGDGWGNSGGMQQQQQQQQSNGQDQSQMWSAWNSQGFGNLTQQRNGSSTGAGSGDPGPNNQLGGDLKL